MVVTLIRSASTRISSCCVQVGRESPCSWGELATMVSSSDSYRASRLPVRRLQPDHQRLERDRLAGTQRSPSQIVLILHGISQGTQTSRWPGRRGALAGSAGSEVPTP